MKPILHIATITALSLSATTVVLAQKASSLPKDLQQQQPPAQQEAKPPVMTHYDPGQYTTESTKDIPQIDPGKIHAPAKHIGPSAVPEAPTAPTGPEVTGFQTPDHLLDDMQRGRLPGDQGRYEQSVRELFGDADSIRDLPGMDGSEVDPMDVLGGRDDALGDHLGGTGTGLDEAGFMPTPTTPGRSPQNTRGGPDRAPVTPGTPRDAMGGAASGDGTSPHLEKHAMYFNEDGSVTRSVVSGDPDTGTTFGYTRTVYPDGTEIEHSGYTFEDGSGYSRETVRDANGQVVSNEEGPYGPQGDRDVDIDQTKDPNDATHAAWVRWHYRNLYHGPKDTGIKDPNRGPPPGGDDRAPSGPGGTDFDLRDDIVINPDPARAAGAGGQLPRASDHRSQIEQDHTPGGYTPEDRGGR